MMPDVTLENTPLKRHLSLFIVATGLGLPLTAMAEESGGDAAGEGDESPPGFVERARELFQMGVEHSDRGEFADAARRFEQALGLHDATTIRFNLASVYVILERRTDAAEQLEVVVAADDVTPEVQTQAEEILSQYRTELGRLRVRLDEPDRSVQVSLDERTITADQLGHLLWVEPGSLVVTATRRGDYVARQDIEIVAGDVEEMTLALAAPAEEPADVGSVEAAMGEDEDGRSRRRGARDYRIWVGVGVGIALAVAAVAVGVSLGTREPEVEPPIVGNFGPGVLEWR